MIYEALNLPVFEKIPENARRLLDLGCGTGAMGWQVKQTTHCEIVGVTHSNIEAGIAAERLDQVLVRDLNTFDPAEAGRFDCVICSHVLEHLYAPDDLLRRLHPCLTENGKLIVALPNLLHWRQRLVFLRGRFRYTDGGLMDRTHFRFFDWTSAHALVRGAGYEVLTAQADGTFPLSRMFFRFGKWLNGRSVKAFPGLFGVQFILICRRTVIQTK